MRHKSPTALSVGRRPIGDDGKTAFVITVEDCNSDYKLLEVEIDAEKLMLALANVMGQPCTVKFNDKGMACFGKTREVMSCKIIERKEGAVIPKKLADAGWELHMGYGSSNARRTPPDSRPYFLCTLIRFVDTPADFEPEVLP